MMKHQKGAFIYPLERMRKSGSRAEKVLMRKAGRQEEPEE
jgi:hypothetical protein